MPDISIIVPVYNTAKYLPDCLDSIIGQSFTDFEVICIDDASTDNSLNILKAYSERDARIRIVSHAENLGLGGARNTGLNEARAPYIASVDSDDWIAPNMLEALLDAVEGGKYDVVCCGFRRVDDEGNVLSLNSHKYREVDLQDAAVDPFTITNPAFWNKLWKRSLFLENGIDFPNHVFYQDLATTPRVYRIASQLKIIPDPLYNYRQRDGSATLNYSEKNLIDYMKVFDVLKSFFVERGEFDKYQKSFYRVVNRSLSFHAKNVLALDADATKKEQYLRHMLFLREGYMNLNESVFGDDAQSLASFIAEETIPSVANSMSESETLEISLLVKTILRPLMLERFLLSAGEYQRALGVVFAEIVVGDDTPADRVQANRNAIRRALSVYPDLRVRHEVFTPDIGLSAGRNQMVDAATQDLVFLCDDDFMLDPASDVRRAVDLLNERNADIVGGWLKNKYDSATGEYQYWGSLGRAINTENDWVVWLNEDPSLQPEVARSDYILNFFIAKRSALKSVRWREELKVEEHAPFFYEFQQRGLTALYSKGLFARHTHEIDNNPAEYNARRHDKSTWENFVRKSLVAMGKKRRTLLRWRPGELVVWEIQNETNQFRPFSIPLKKPVLEQIVPIRRLTPRFENWFHGYYDTQAVSPEGDVALVQSCTALRRLPEPGDRVEIGLAPMDGSGEIETIGETSAWCHQLGACLQFAPGAGRVAVWNIFDENRGEFGAELLDLDTREKRRLNAPIAALSPAGAVAASLNFSRLFDYRPGYGYPHLVDPHVDVSAPDDDGLWIIDLETGDKRLAISLAELRKSLATGETAAHRSGKWVINHVAFSPSGREVFMLVRVFSESAPFPTFSVVCDIDGGNLRRVFGFGSHYHWTDNDRIVISGAPGFTREQAKPIQVHEVNVRTLESRVIAKGQLAGDGHCSWSPDRTMLLYDSYPTKELPYRNLKIHDVARNRTITLGWFFAEPKIHGETDTRCDLHPRWSSDGKTITFDSLHEGFRATYAIDVQDIRKAFESDIIPLEEDDLIAWHRARHLRRRGDMDLPFGRKLGPRARDRLLAEFAQNAKRRAARVGSAFKRRLNLLQDARLLSGSELFDPDWYRATYTDVAEANMSPVAHYLRYGAAEGRDPGPRFSTVDYMIHNTDVFNAGLNPLVHYLRFGKKERRNGPFLRRR